MMNGRGEVGSPDPLDSFPPLRIRQSDGASRHSSDSEFERYCSANSVMGTPNTSMSMCSAITLFHDFSDCDFACSSVDGNNGLENLNLGRGIVEIRNNDQKRNLRYGSSGLELYGDCSDDLSMTVLDSSELIGFKENEVSKGNREEDGGNGIDGFGLEIEDRELKREEEGEFSEGDDSVYDYGSDGDEGNETYLSRSVCYRREPEVRSEDPLIMNSSVAFGLRDLDDYHRKLEAGNENSLFMNSSVAFGSRDLDDYHRKLEVGNENSLFMDSSVAFGSRDLDDFLLQNGPMSGMNDLFCDRRENNGQVQENRVDSGSVGLNGFGQEEEKDGNDTIMVNKEVEETKDIDCSAAIKEARDGEIIAACGQVQNADVCNTITESFPLTDCSNGVIPQVQGSDILISCTDTTSMTKVDEVDLNLLAKEAPQDMGLDATDGGSMERRNQCVNIEKAIATGNAQLVNPELDNSKFKLDHFCDNRVDKNSFNLSNQLGDINAKSFESLEKIAQPLNSRTRKTLESSSTSTDLFEESPVTSKIEDFELNEFYDEVVQEMEEILLESMDSPGARFSMGSNRLLEPQLATPLRDGGLTASTSTTDDAYLLVQRPRRIDKIEVVGARQKKGDVSFSERLVGVKEYTVYKIKVYSGKDQWEVERRYRDFLAFYRCMKTLFNEQGWKLPLPWSSVEKETKIFRSASSPDIIVKRSVLIQECLQSILRSRSFSSPPKALIWFLSHQDSFPTSPVSDTPVSQSSFTRGENIQNSSTLGKTISLIVEIPPNKSMKKLLEAQQHTCAGCHKHFDDGKALIWDFVQTFGWGKSRLCEYTGQLFCSSCHTNETAVLPARVLHHWDFTHYPVSQLAKSYLDSIHDKPMLCVTAVNPLLLSKVPALLHIMSVRKKIGTMLPYVRCPFRRSINRGLGNRRYLLENNDFFALRDLIELSKGVFAALPVMVETLSRKILEHITDQCLVCCDVGVPCNARQECSDPSSLIFPFQNNYIELMVHGANVVYFRGFKLKACLYQEPNGVCQP
ncbi:uncharacterized protein LOC113852475 isoform X2 [Abrus precatorius]|uniref:Uncharacterized protein LOC113852475 isoform X2 n=1 Tax=Abrus precatorius TaxID=3816 RepID=A0A8B8K630_ABRPR|nr:uncharacterized protein LOC113852475 isoform X2 [Abrus precatorius]